MTPLAPPWIQLAVDDEVGWYRLPLRIGWGTVDLELESAFAEVADLLLAWEPAQGVVTWARRPRSGGTDEGWGHWSVGERRRYAGVTLELRALAPAHGEPTPSTDATAWTRAVVAAVREDERRSDEAAVEAAIVRALDGVPACWRREVEVAARAALLGLGPLEPLLADPTIGEIMVNGPDQIYVERSGCLERVASRFTDEEALWAVIERILAPVGRHVDPRTPTADARLPDGSRVHVIVPPLAVDGPVVTIRKFAHARWTAEALVDAGTLSQELLTRLATAVRERRNLVVSGGTGSGKTTFLNVLSGFVPEGERIVTIEDAAELRLHQEHVVRLEARAERTDGAPPVTIRDLVREALRMRPDRIVVGECRGPEALDMLQAMNTGHEGTLTTVHANGARDALARIETMSLMAGSGLPLRAIRDQIARAIDLVVHLVRAPDGRRYVAEVLEVCGLEGEVYLTREVWRRDGTMRGLANPEVSW